MGGNGQPPGGGAGGSNAAAIMLAGLASAYAVVIAGTHGLVQLTGLIALVLVTAVAAWLFATGRVG